MANFELPGRYGRSAKCSPKSTDGLLELFFMSARPFARRLRIHRKAGRRRADGKSCFMTRGMRRCDSEEDVEDEQGDGEVVEQHRRHSADADLARCPEEERERQSDRLRPL